MPFHEVRDLAEHLKLLGYPHSFPLQALSKNCGCLASFYVVAEVLQWLANLMEPGVILAGSIHTKDDRVLLVRSATEFFVTKSALKLNPRKLYAACSVTAGELQKITKLLIAPADAFSNASEDGELDQINQIDIGDKMDDLRKARDISRELAQKAKTLNNLLLKETDNKEERLNQAARPLELAVVQRHLKNAVASAQVKLKSDRIQLENARIELNALNSKLTRKRGELERTKQRLEALQKIRPAHMQEFEECEKELKSLFQQYFRRVHVRDALKAQFEERNKKTAIISSPTAVQKHTENSMPFLAEGLFIDHDNAIDGINNRDDDTNDADDDDDTTQLVIPSSSYGIHPINERETKSKDNRRPSTATRRSRPAQLDRIIKGSTTATIRRDQDIRNRKSEDNAKVYAEGVDGVAGVGAINNNDDDDSSFGSMDSDLNMSELLAIDGPDAGTSAGAGTGIGADISDIGAVVGDGDGNHNHNVDNNRIIRTVGNLNHLQIIDDDDDDFDLNSMESISISKLTGELPLRPKTAAKQELHHSDEDF